jgi:hypothetical protein
MNTNYKLPPPVEFKLFTLFLCLVYVILIINYVFFMFELCNFKLFL